jgi:AcrR family transcriptional regulator
MVSELDDVVVQRRAPFADNPMVGERGTRTQQRILRAALDVFAEVGYHACRVERITAVSGCSRPAFYQYFSSKEEVFRHLAGQLARALSDITDQLPPVTGDEQGRQELLAWLVRYGDLYDEYAALFAAFSSAVGEDDVVAAGADSVGRRLTKGLAAKMPKEPAPVGRPKIVASVLLNAVARTNRFRQVLEGGASIGIVPLERQRVDAALTDLVHRVMFGAVPGVNVRPSAGSHRKRGRPEMPEMPALAAGALAVGDGRVLGPAGQATRGRLLEAGAEVFARRGYHDTRVDDIAEVAGVSHGTFYRYFPNKDEVFRVLATRAGRRVVAAMEGMPDVAAPELRDWLSDYAEGYATAAPIIRAWIEAISLDPGLGALSTYAVEQVRQRLAGTLDGRQFGDADADALVLLGLVDLAEYRPAKGGTVAPEMLDVVADVIRRGFVDPVP